MEFADSRRGDHDTSETVSRNIQEFIICMGDKDSGHHQFQMMSEGIVFHTRKKGSAYPWEKIIASFPANLQKNG